MTAAAAEQVIVDRRGHRQRLDRYLALLARWGSRARVQRLIESGSVRVNGQPGKTDAMLSVGQLIEVDTPPPQSVATVEAEEIPLDIVFEDEWILVINKPPDLVVHPAPGHGRGTLVNALLHHWRGMRPGLDPLRPGIVHRLDKDTSGVLLIAKDPDTHAAVGKQFQDRSVEKQYLAAVWGRPRLSRGTVDGPIGRNPLHRKRMAIQASGRAALTTYEVIRVGSDVSWLRLFPKTGRTHQIRVHLASIGCPIVGDQLYGRARRSDAVAEVGRQALHAERLSIDHPQTGERMVFVAPLAADLLALWECCEEFA